MYRQPLSVSFDGRRKSVQSYLSEFRVAMYIFSRSPVTIFDTRFLAVSTVVRLELTSLN